MIWNPETNMPYLTILSTHNHIFHNVFSIVAITCNFTRLQLYHINKYAVIARDIWETSRPKMPMFEGCNLQSSCAECMKVVCKNNLRKTLIIPELQNTEGLDLHSIYKRDHFCEPSVGILLHNVPKAWTTWDRFVTDPLMSFLIEYRIWSNSFHDPKRWHDSEVAYADQR